MTAPSNVDEQGREIIGYQIVDESGHTVQGTEIDPFEIYGENVLTGNAVRTHRTGWSFIPGFLSRRFPRGSTRSHGLSKLSKIATRSASNWSIATGHLWKTCRACLSVTN